jgi:glycerol-3-phosphate dehydrogenase subunit C
MTEDMTDRTDSDDTDRTAPKPDSQPHVPRAEHGTFDVHVPADTPTDDADATAGDTAVDDADKDPIPDGGLSAAESTVDDPTDPVDLFDMGNLDLREGADDCYKCTSCDTSCPVAEVDDEFPGPKFQGPEQWRLKKKNDQDIDPSISSCSNCMRCDSACPSSVPLSQMHNEARGEYVARQMDKLSIEYLRNRVLSNYRTSAWLASKVPRLATFAMNFGPARWLMEKTMGVTNEREFPEFATQTFRQWWVKRGGAQVSNSDKQVAYFHGCYSNFNTPEVAKAMVRVYEQFGYEVLVPPQKCSGTPMFANGMLPDARRHAETNVRNLAAAIADGADVIASCTSCSLSLRQEYPELFDITGIDAVSKNTFEALEYLRIYEDLEGALAGSELDGEEFAYHAPCHARNQGLHRQAIELFRDVSGVTIEDVGDSCSGISGTYGWKAEKYETSMAIGEEMFEHMDDAEGTVGMTECPTCAMQMEHGTGYSIRHPLELLEAALVD